MEELRQMIERRNGSVGEGGLQRTSSITLANAGSAFDTNRLQQWTKTVESLVEDADKQIAQAIDQSEALVKDMALLAVRNDVRNISFCSPNDAYAISFPVTCGRRAREGADRTTE